MAAEPAAKAPALAQVRLSPEEWAELRSAMRILHLDSTSAALREGIRLLHREAAEAAAAEEIREFYGTDGAPVPAGVAQVSQEELDAADRSEW